jgi:hypothetical protein
LDRLVCCIASILLGLLSLIFDRVNPNNADVVKAVDFVGTDGYPYWQGAMISQSADIFWNSVNDVRNAVNKIKVCYSQLSLLSIDGDYNMANITSSLVSQCGPQKQAGR